MDLRLFMILICCFFNDTATTEIYTYLHTLSLHDALPISLRPSSRAGFTFGSSRFDLGSSRFGFGAGLRSTFALSSRLLRGARSSVNGAALSPLGSLSPRTSITVPVSFWILRSEEHTSELQSLMRISYAVFCLKKKTYYNHNARTN